MKTICLFNSELAWGGGEKWHLETSSYLNNKDYRVIVYCHKNGELRKKLEKDGIEIRLISIGNLSFLNLFKILQLMFLFIKDKPNAVIYNISKDIKVGALAAKWAGVKTIIYRRGSAIPIKNNFLNRWYFKNIISQILVNSFETKKTINQKNANMFPEDKIKVIYNGLRLNHYKFKEKQAKDIFTIGNLGRLEYQKNQTALLDLAVVLKQKITDFEIVIGGDGRLLQELKQKAEQLKVTDVVRFTGYVTKVSEFMSQIDVFVLTSHWEGFGYVVAEASYFKKPVIAYNVSSNPEVVLDNKTGFLVAKDNIEQIVKHVVELQKNRDLIAQMGLAGNTFVKENFDAKVNQQKVENYLLELI
ncbi:glycosyltransferase involved in cell wall biosynthesis [Wenyingzhuangia heitensis]|uniref:Glycosyltransferase involved in cell wall biosynthesis n=1 Tax=Wenyingzhuangia heitensis TaxID=1487859 RepID=A0ABX0UAM5_9FLAO|nr:glycosyltransferase [Wenyingzhuangia heitensis]NIJ45773.1 glycosyltransferase involved in cell wall biosynthesis [Wenyingzhuangia heitensis]